MQVLYNCIRSPDSVMQLKPSTQFMTVYSTCREDTKMIPYYTLNMSVCVTTHHSHQASTTVMFGMTQHLKNATLVVIIKYQDSPAT